MKVHGRTELNIVVHTPTPLRATALYPLLWGLHEAGYTLSVMCDTFTEHTLVKCETTSGIHEMVI